MEFPIVFLLHTFLETQRKWSTTEQEAYGVYYAITKWNYYLQGADIVIRNDHKALNRFLNGKNANNKMNKWGLELAMYNITFEWISGDCNKAVDCLSCLVDLPQHKPIPINILSVMNTDGPAFNTRSQTHQCLSPRYFHPTARYYTRSFRSNRSYTKMPDSRQVRSSPADAEN